MWAYLVAIAICAFAIKRYNRLFVGFEKVDSMFPGPPSLPIIGNLAYFIGSPSVLGKRAISVITSYNRSIRVWLFHRLFIIAVKPHEVEAILTNRDNLRKSHLYDYLILWIGRGLLTSDGDKWKKNRKLLTPAFHFKILESFVGILCANSKTLCEKLDSEVGNSGFDIMNYIRLHTLDNICETSMGIKVNLQVNPDTELIGAISKICSIAFARAISPWLQWDPWFNLTRLGREQKKALDVLHQFTRNIIDTRIQRRENIRKDKTEQDGDENNVFGNKKNQTLIDILLDAMDEGRLTRQDLQDEIDTFIFEGHDTITSALSFCIYNLAHHPQYQEMAFDEVREIFGDSVRQCTADDVSKMNYLEMVIKESLRLYPSVPSFARCIEKDLPLDKDTIIPKGCEVIILPLVMHMNPEYWERPYEFYPNHFLPETASKRHPFTFIPFSAGPRNCIGRRLAMLEMKITISDILRKFLLLPHKPVVRIRLSGEITL